MAKQDVVNEWWQGRLEDGTQVAEAKKHRDNRLLLEVTGDPRWFSRVDTDALFIDHIDWCNVHGYTEHAENLSKSGFMLMFYRASGATRSRTRIGLNGDKTRYVAAFRDIEYHKGWYRSSFPETVGHT